MVWNTNTQILVVIARTIFAVLDTDLSWIMQNWGANVDDLGAMRQNKFGAKKTVIMGWSTKWGDLTL